MDDELQRIREKKLREMEEHLHGSNVPLVQPINSANFRKILADNPFLVIDFWAEWCGPCRMVGPVIEELSREYSGQVTFAKCNTDENPAIAGGFGISAIPTIILFQNGKEYSAANPVARQPPRARPALDCLRVAPKELGHFPSRQQGVGWSWGDNSIRLVGFVQLRFIAEDTEELDLDPVGSTGYGEPDGLITAFQIPRARLGFKGTMWKPWLKYALVYELSQTSGDKDAKLKDAYVEFAAKPLASIRFGQFKVPFGFQELVPDEAQLFAERAITNAARVFGL